MRIVDGRDSFVCNPREKNCPQTTVTSRPKICADGSINLRCKTRTG